MSIKFINKQKVYFKKWNLLQYQSNLTRIKNLRKTYQNFPYLYVYDEQEELRYHDAYMSAKDNLDAYVALYEEKLIGISIGCPLLPEIPICSDLVDKFLSKKTYYFGDIIVAKEFWGLKIAQELYQLHINDVVSKKFQRIIALLVSRNENDPRFREQISLIT